MTERTKNFLLSLALALPMTAAIFAFCFWIVAEYGNSHPHGLPGVLTVLSSFVAYGLIFVKDLIFFLRKHNPLKLSLLTSLGICAFFAAASLVLEL